jgi:hypothetical protein
VQLRPHDAMAEAMLRGWRAQQCARGLREDTRRCFRHLPPACHTTVGPSPKPGDHWSIHVTTLDGDTLVRVVGDEPAERLWCVGQTGLTSSPWPGATFVLLQSWHPHLALIGRHVREGLGVAGAVEHVGSEASGP